MGKVYEVTQIGKREDLSDIVSVADAKNTPLSSMMRKGKKPANTLYSWQAGGIPDPDTDPIPDGKPVDNTEDMSGNRQNLFGRVHKIRRTPSVSEMAEDVSNVAGIASEFQKSKALSVVAVKRAIEAIYAGDQDSSLVGQTHQCRGIGKWLQDTEQADLPVHASYRTPLASIYTGALSDIKENTLQDLMQSIYEQTGEMGNWDGIFGTALKRHVSKMMIYDDSDPATVQIVRTFFAKIEDNKLVQRVDVISGDFGTIRIHPTLWNAWNNTTKKPDPKRGYILDMTDIEMVANKLPGFKPLPEDDSGPRGVVSAIVGMKLYNPLKHGKIAPTS